MFCFRSPSMKSVSHTNRGTIQSEVMQNLYQNAKSHLEIRLPKWSKYILLDERHIAHIQVKIKKDPRIFLLRIFLISDYLTQYYSSLLMTMYIYRFVSFLYWQHRRTRFFHLCMRNDGNRINGTWSYDNLQVLIVL